MIKSSNFTNSFTALLVEQIARLYIIQLIEWGGIIINTKLLNKKVVITICSLAVILIVGLLFFNNNKLSATDVLKNADFNVDNPTVTIETVHVEIEEKFKEVRLSQETQQEILKAFENAEFEKITESDIDYDYRIDIRLNNSYPMYLISNKKQITMAYTDEFYVIVNDRGLFDILEKATK